MRRLLIVVLISGLAVAAVAGGALVSDAVSSSGSSTVLPSVGPVAAVIGPSDGHFGDLPAGVPGGGGSTAGGSTPAATPIFDPEGIATPYLPAGTGSVGGGPARFIDPCADHGSDCSGVGGTILGDTIVPTFAIAFVQAQLCLGRGPGDPFVVGVPITIQANLPGDFVATLTDRSNPGDVRHTRGSTTDTEVRSEGGTGRTDGSPPPFFNTCVGVILPNRSTTWDIVVDGTSPDGQTTSHTSAFAFSGTGGRPAVQIDTPAAPFENQLRVVVPAKSGSRGGVIARLLDASGAPGNVCRSRESDQVGFSTPRDATLPIAAAELGAHGYAYDLAYDSRETKIFGLTDRDQLIAGQKYDLCIWWLDGSSPNHVTERVAYRVVAPNRYKVFVRVARIDFTHDRIPSDYTVTTDLNAGGGCRIVPFGTLRVGGADYTGPAFHPEMYPGSAGSCNHEDGLEQVPGSMVEAATFDPLLRVEVTGGGGDVVEYLHMPLSGCPDHGACDTNADFSEDYVISLGSVTTGLCGGSFGDCTPPSESIGTITVRLRFLGTQPADGGRFWQIDRTPHPV